MAKGRKTGGRTKGVPNRVTTRMREGRIVRGHARTVHVGPPARSQRPERRRDWAVEKPAPYCDPRLASTELSGVYGSPIEVRTTNKPTSRRYRMNGWTR